MRTVVVPPPKTAVVERQVSVVVIREKGGAPAVTRQGAGQSVVATRGVPGLPGPIGPPGPAGGATQLTVGAAPLSGHSAVACDATGLLVPADCTNPAHRGAVLGLVTNAYSPGEAAVVQTSFVLEHAGWTWAPGPLFVGVAGQLAQVLPAGALFCQVIGQVLSPARVLVDVQPPITLI